MSRSTGGRSLTTLSPMRISPLVISSRPATIRSAVVFPQPDGPTRIRNSPSFTSSVRLSTAIVPSSNCFVTSLNAIVAIS